MTAQPRQSWPTNCADVTYDMRDVREGETFHDAEVGDLLWNPKGGDGHLLVEEVRCGEVHGRGRYPTLGADCGCGGWGMQPCPSRTLICECGQDGSWRDHHFELLARRREQG